ncbi:MAG: 50S ribosomal protein L21 [Patescibacteria group bacterium]|jgi:large subunit ribosomal protein L21
MKMAVIKTGGKQYLVAPKDKIKVEKLPGDVSSDVVFSEVLMTADGDKAEVGKPYLAGVKVTGKIVRQAREPKVTVIKYKAKTRYRRKVGHRHAFTEVEIGAIA